MRQFATDVVDAALDTLRERPGVGDELMFLEDEFPNDWENVRQVLIERVEQVLSTALPIPVVGSFG